MKACVIAYVPPPPIGCAKAFLENITAFKTREPLILFSDHPYKLPEGIEFIHLQGSPEVLKNARYPDHRENQWAISNVLALVAFKIVRDRGFTHFNYIESDCRVLGDNWDAPMFDEFEAGGPGIMVGGSVVAYNPCSGGHEFALAWQRFIARHGDHPFPIPAYGGNGAAEATEPVILANGALAIYDVSFCLSVCNPDEQVAEAARITAFDYHIGRELTRKFKTDVFKKIVHLRSSYSGYGDVMYTEEQRAALLQSGQIFAVHQIKSGWQPAKTLVGSVAEMADAKGVTTPTCDASTAGAKTEGTRLDTEELPSSAGSSPATAPNVTILIVTHQKDAAYLAACLASIRKFATGFYQVVVAMPVGDKPAIAAACGDELTAPGVVVKEFDQAPSPKEFLHHMAVKVMAHKYCEGADFILYMDSDCIFSESVTPCDYFVGGKPVLLMQSYEQLKRQNSNSVVWQDGTQKTLGMGVQFEFMCRHPAVHYQETCAGVIDRIEKLHCKPFLEYVLEQKADFPCGTNDFNVLGAYAWAYMHEKYHFIDIGWRPSDKPKDKVIQFWSHSPIDKLHEGRIPMEVIKKVLAI